MGTLKVKERPFPGCGRAFTVCSFLFLALLQRDTDLFISSGGHSSAHPVTPEDAGQHPDGPQPSQGGVPLPPSPEDHLQVKTQSYFASPCPALCPSFSVSGELFSETSLGQNPFSGSASRELNLRQYDKWKWIKWQKLVLV